MPTNEEEWRPGSFTKNFSWGREGLARLHKSIRIGFGDEMADVPRQVFRQRVKQASHIDYIPVNFFLFNKQRDGTDYLLADELVFQALTSDHSPNFDKLALFTFNFSYVGVWRSAKAYQRRPALWAHHYVRDRVAGEFRWNTRQVSAPDIEAYVTGDPRYKAQTTGKLSTNLAYLYVIGRLSEFAEKRIERWWTDALFLALDRLTEDRRLDRLRTPQAEYAALLSQSGFHIITGPRSLEKDLAVAHLATLYGACGGIARFSDESAGSQPDKDSGDGRPRINDTRPWGAVHPTNPRILKSIPRVCAALARTVGFQIVDADELAEFDAEHFIREQVGDALKSLRKQKVLPTMSVDELMKLTRER